MLVNQSPIAIAFFFIASLLPESPIRQTDASLATIGTNINLVLHVIYRKEFALPFIAYM